MKNFSFLFWAYNVIWAGLAVFLVVTWRRLSQAERRLDRLESGPNGVRPGDRP